MEMLFCTSLLALVGAADHPHLSPRKLQIVNTKVSMTDSVAQYTGLHRASQIWPCSAICWILTTPTCSGNP